MGKLIRRFLLGGTLAIFALAAFGVKASAAEQTELGPLVAVKRTFTLNVANLLKNCKVETEGQDQPTSHFECRVQEFSLNGSESVMGGTSGRNGIAQIYPGNAGIFLLLEITPEGYRTRFKFPTEEQNPTQILKDVFEKNKLDGKKLSLLIYTVKN
jgi:hypothetical protein